MRNTIITICLAASIIMGFVLPACGQSHNKFEVLSFDVNPQQSFVGEAVTVKATVANINEEDDTYDIALMVNNVAENRHIITVPSGGTKEVVFSLVERKAGNYKVAIGDRNITLVVRDVPPPEFHIFEFEINPAKVDMGDKVVISGKVKNTGGSKGRYVAQLLINGTPREVQNVNLEPGEDILLIFSVTEDEPGTYVAILGDADGYYEVTKLVEPTWIIPPVKTPAAGNSRNCGPGG